MFYVYRIHSRHFPERNYVGYSKDLKQRLTDYNAGKNRFTAPFCPWKLVFYAAFESEESAREFERYLKTCPGEKYSAP